MRIHGSALHKYGLDDASARKHPTYSHQDTNGGYFFKGSGPKKDKTHNHSRTRKADPHQQYVKTPAGWEPVKGRSGQDFNILGHAALPGGHAGYGR
jgi:hypothetical protein